MSLERCKEHGLVFDPAIAAGCVLCRSSTAPPGNGPSSFKSKAIGAGAMVVAALFLWWKAGALFGRHNDAGGTHAAAVSAAAPTFSQLRAANPTHLRVHQRSPQQHEQLRSSAGVELVRYESGALRLAALFRKATSDALVRDGRYPVLVYLHGGFALGADDVADCRPFVDAGFEIFAPSFRGENDNPGDHELYYGELDDARAAIAHAGELPSADPRRVVVFGHSAGGNLAALAALYPDLPARYTGSAGGIMSEAGLSRRFLPFVDSEIERRLRVFGPFAAELAKPHFACAGSSDDAIRPSAQALVDRPELARVPLEVVFVSGDHFTSLTGCMTEFLQRVRGVM